MKDTHPMVHLPTLKRRDFLQQAAAGAAALTSLSVLGADQAGAAPAAGTPIGLPRLGTLRVRSSRDVKASPLSVGMECLDRRMYTPERTYGPLAALGVKWARVQTGWARTETAKGRYDFTWLDEVVDAVRAAGVEPWFNLGYGNPLYSPDAADQSAVGYAPIVGEEPRAAWRRFVAALAAHFRGRVRFWEIWNEPNLKTFWTSTTPSAADYMNLVKLTAPVIREKIPDVVLIGGGFAGMPTEFLYGCLELGLAADVDCISYHPYALVPEKGYAEAVGTWRALVARYNSKVALWQGECGCPSTQGGVGALAQHQWNETRQAKWFLRRNLLDLSLGLELVSHFHLVDLVKYHWAGRTVLETTDKKTRTNFRADFGLLRGEDYTPKPSYFACQRLCALFDADTKPAPTVLTFASAGRPEPASAITQAAFQRAGQRLHAYWLPTDLQKHTAPQTVAATLPAIAATGLRQPVLLDLLTGEYYELHGERKGVTWSIANLPLTDYPLILTDRSVV